jgi:hypothetical protein
VGLVIDVVVAVRAAAVRHDRNAIGHRQGADTYEFGQPAHPHHVGLRDIDTAHLDQWGRLNLTVS